MKGDFSRRTFDPHKHYSAVLQEQGRMLTDADLDEQGRIVAHRIEQEAADLVGGCGGPIADAGFQISESGGDLMIGDGRYYADGILVENDQEMPFTGQPGLPEPQWPPEDGTGRYAVYLDVWRRLITAIDDPLIREVALGGPTTAVREKTVWQVRLAQTEDDATCLTGLPEMLETTGRMAAQADPEVAPVAPCEVPLTAGFKGLENQFYRIEIFDSGPAVDLAGTSGDTLAITGFVQGNQVELAGLGSLGLNDAVVYGTGDVASMEEIGFAHVVNITGNIVTLSTNVEPVALAGLPWLREADATFVWSRDNGSQVTAVTAIDDDLIGVRDTGPDDVRGFMPGQWVELTDDLRELDPGRQRRTLLRVIDVDHVARTVRVRTSPTDFDFDTAINPKLRRWDGARGISVNQPAGNDWLHVEDGIQVRFTDDIYRTGDYWHFPARTATIDPQLGVIEWPMGLGDPELLAPHGTQHHYCKLAWFDLTIIDDETHTVENLTDCRNFFPPVTELTNLLYVGGDAQEGRPNLTAAPAQQIPLERPLQVGVTNGSHPVEGARVQFTITAGTGTLPDGNTVTTDSDGIATCRWNLGGSPVVQVCEARLLDADEQAFPHQAVNFHGRLSRAADVAYDPRDCPTLANARTVQQAIDILCRQEHSGGCCCVPVGPGQEFDELQRAIRELIERGERDICICLLPGDHQLEELEIGVDGAEERFHLTIKGCGPNTRIRVVADIHLVGFASVILRDFEMVFDEGLGMSIRNCEHAEITSCQIRGGRGEQALIRIFHASDLIVRDNRIESVRERGFRPSDLVFEGIATLPEVFRIENPQEFRRRASELSEFFARSNRNDRNGMATMVESQLRDIRPSLSSQERREYQRFIAELRAPRADPQVVVSILDSLRLVTRSTMPGVAIEIADPLDPGAEGRARIPQEAMRVLESNVVVGSVSLYGPADPDSGEEFPPPQIVERLGPILEERIQFIFGGRGTFHLRGNRLYRLLVAQEAIEILERVVEEPESVRIFFDNMFVTDNVFEGMRSQIITRHLSMSGNDFNQTSEEEILVASVVGDALVYSGNYGFPVGRQIFARIANFSRAMSQAANLELEIG